MRIKLFLSLIALLVASYVYAAEVSKFIAVSADDDNTSYVLADVKRINVVADSNGASMTVVNKDGEEFAGYKKILFAETETGIDEMEISSVYVYPNPVVNTLYIQGVEEGTLLEVYNLAGKTLLQEKGVELNVTSLPSGTYILRIDQQYVKFIKK